MWHEIDPIVRDWLDDQIKKQDRPNLTSLLQKLAVKIVDEITTLNAWAWRRRGYTPEHIVTVWAEEVHINQHGGWETEISLDPSGDPHYNDAQRNRERERIEILHELATTKHNCKVILMINERSQEQQAKGVASKALRRVLDDVEWHAEFPTGSRRGVLHRGPRPPTQPGASPEVDGDDIWAADETSTSSPRFPDQEMRDRVERAAVDHAMLEYASHGRVESVEDQNLGYDLDVIDHITGDIKYKVEVKGTAADEEVFYLTRNELRAAKEDPQRWRLAIVVHALENPDLRPYRVHEMERTFQMAPLVWHCSPKLD